QRPDIKKAELVERVVYVASPTRASVHGKPHSIIVLWLGTYAGRSTGVKIYDNRTVFLDATNEVQPDACLLRQPPPAPSAARVRADDYIEGAPQLVVEVAASGASIDLHDKLRAYERAVMQEYIVWRTIDWAVD